MTIASDMRIERRTAVTGLGQSQVGRRIGRDPLDLTLDACLLAIDDAGLSRADIDGIATYPGGGGTPAGFSGAGVLEVQDALRLELGWFTGGIELPGQLGSVIDACLAVAAGLADHVLCFRSVWEATAQGDKGRAGVMPGAGSDESSGGDGGGGDSGGGFRAPAYMQWTLPFAAPSAAIWLAMNAQRHFHEFGTTREQMAQIALNARKNAQLNPNAVYRDPMTMDDYLAARMITTPFCLFDCDAPADGATAMIVSRAETAVDMPHRPVVVEAVGSAMRGRPSWDQFDDLTTMASRDAGEQLWTRTDLTPADVHVAELYDGFSFITMTWLEALGFCGRGESGPFIEGGGRIALDGDLPLNTQGGQLSGGRLHGYGFLHEAVTQLRGDAGERQVAGGPTVGVAAAGGGPLAGCMLLHAG